MLLMLSLATFFGTRLEFKHKCNGTCSPSANIFNSAALSVEISVCPGSGCLRLTSEW